MAITIQGPDGASIDFPDGTSDAEMSAAMVQAYPHPSDAAQTPLAGPGGMAGVSRALEANLPFVDRAVAAAKSALPQGYGGTGQDYAANLVAEKAKNAQFAEQNPWTNAVGGLTAYAPAALLPAGAGLYGRIGTGALTGFGLGGIQGASNSQDLTNTQETGRNIAQGEATGGALGAFVPAVAHGIGSLVSMGPIDPARQALVDTLQSVGIKPTAGQITGNQGLQKLEASISDIPFGGGGVEVSRQANAKAFTKAILAKAGFPEVADASQESLNAAHKALGAQFDALGARNSIPADPQLTSDLSDAVSGYHDLTGTPAPGVGKIVDAIKTAPQVPSPRLVVAAKTSDGGIIYGQPGQTHADLYEPGYGLDNPAIGDLGFALPGGPFMSRKEAGDFVSGLRTINKGEGAYNILDAERYNAARAARNAYDTGPQEAQPFATGPQASFRANAAERAPEDFADTIQTLASSTAGRPEPEWIKELPADEREFEYLYHEYGQKYPDAGSPERFKERIASIQGLPQGTADRLGLQTPAPSAPIAAQGPRPAAPRVILGEEYNNLRSQLGKTAQKLRFTDPAQAEAYRGVQDALDSAMERSIAATNPDDIGAFQAVRQKYKNLMPIEQAAASSGADAASGIISPQQMRTALAAGGNRRSYARGIGDLAPLTNAGNAILTNFPQSGTAPRTMMAHALQGMGGLVGGLGGAPGGIEGAGLGATAGALAFPALAGRAIMSRPGQSILESALAKRLPAAQPRSMSRAAMAAALGANADLQAQRNQVTPQ